MLPNLYGDIVSDLCAGLVGGLGVVPGANIGIKASVFEAVHGSAPDIAGQGLANPTALLLSGLMMLRHIGEGAAADRVLAALMRVLEAGTPDAGPEGDRLHHGFTDAICRRSTPPRDARPIHHALQDGSLKRPGARRRPLCGDGDAQSLGATRQISDGCGRRSAPRSAGAEAPALPDPARSIGAWSASSASRRDGSDASSISNHKSHLDLLELLALEDFRSGRR